MAHLTGFSRFGVYVGDTLTFIGSDNAEQLAISGYFEYWIPTSKGAIDARMRGGNDVVRFYGGAPGSSFDGGNGTDWFAFQNMASRNFDGTFFDMSSGTLRDTVNGRETTTQGEQSTSRTRACWLPNDG
jgi:hypothetical protein